MGMLGTRRRFFGNIVGHAKGVGDASSLMSWTNEQFDPQLDWGKVAKIKEMWGGKLILKGVLDAEDAKAAADVGLRRDHRVEPWRAAAGRRAVVDPDAALDRRGGGWQTEVWLDRRHPLGPGRAEGAGAGRDRHDDRPRSYIYGLGAMGEAGVTRALEVIRKEMDITMALCGVRRIDEVRRTNDPIVLVPEDFAGRWA